MSQTNSGRRTALNVKFNNVDITENITENLISLTYTDATEGETDDLKIVIHDREGKWVRDWLKREMEQRDSANAAIASGEAGVSADSSGTQNYTVTAKIGLAVRAGRGTGYRQLGAIPYGATVQTAEIVSGWATISYSGQTGYINANYLTPAEPSGKSTGGSQSQDGSGTAHAKYTKVSAVITALNTDSNGKDKVLDCGKFELDSVRFTTPPNRLEMSATSLSYESSLRKTKKTRGYS